MSQIVTVNTDKCEGCNSCLRSCPAPEANIVKKLDDGRFVIDIKPDKCIACGECINACKAGARDYKDDIDSFMPKINTEKAVILVSPAIQSILPSKWKGILDWFTQQGCTVIDISVGADICTWAHLRAADQGTVGKVISSQCASVVKYIELYKPKLVQSLSPIQDPVGCAAIYVRKYLRRSNPIVVLSPCIAMKFTADENDNINYVITIKRLLEYFDKKKISIPENDPNDFEYSFSEPQGQLGTIYSRPGGLAENIWSHVPDANISCSDGVSRVYPQLNIYAKMSEAKQPEIFDVLSCEHGCNMGSACGKKNSFFDVMASMRAIEAASRGRVKKNTGIIGRGDDKLFKKYDDELSLVDFIRNYKPAMPTSAPGITQLAPIFDEIGLITEAERSRDCRACGFNTCREMATAIYRGLNIPENCIRNVKSASNGIDKKTADECLELSAKVAENVSKISDGMKNIGDTSDSISERAATVKDLLENVVEFCNDNPTMDSDSVGQLISILETTISALGALDENVAAANENTDSIQKSIADITAFIDDIEKTLGKTEENQKNNTKK